MRKYIHYLTVLLSVLLVTTTAMGQPAGWKKLPNPSGTSYNLEPGNYYLEKDMTVNGRWRFGNSSAHKDGIYTINLNGHTIDAKNVHGSSILNMTSGTLTLIDEPYDGSTPDGKIINSTATCVYVGPGSSRTATFNMKGGTIENCQPSNGEGGAVEVEQATGETAIFNMYAGAKITNCFAAQGAGVYVNGGSFTMYGGIITNNKIFSVVKDAANSGWSKPTGDQLPTGINSYTDHEADGNRINDNYEYKGGGVYIEKGSFTMSGGEISENVSINGGGVYVVSNATFNLTGGTIKNNYASSRGSDFGNGGGIYIFGGSNCTITKGNNDLIIEGNRVSKYGGAIYVNGSTVTLNGCTISGNYAGAGGGLAQEGNSCTLNLNNCIVNNNYSKENTSINYSNEGSGGGIYIGNGGSSTNKNNLNIQSSKILGNNSDKSGGGIYTGTNTAISVKANHYATIDGNIAKSQNGGGIYQAGGTFTVETGGQLNVGTQQGKNQSTSGNGGGIYCGGTFTINGSANVGYNNAINGGGIYCAGTFTISGNANVSYNTAQNGGGICVENGTITLPAGENSIISYNSASELGGGLYVVNSTSANFNGGKFSYNTAKSGGAVAAVNTTSGKTTTLSLGAQMEYNTASAGNGGGIYMNNGIRMTFGNGLIRRNNAESTGTNYTTANGKDHTSVQGAGGGIFMGASCTLNFNSTEMGIYDNYAENAGADICANGSSTSIVLPNITNMTLKDWNIPATQNGLYWVEDYFTNETYTDINSNSKTGIRYQDALNDPEKNDDIFNYQVQGGKTYGNYLCLDLGYDLVFVRLTTAGLNQNDDAAILMSYPSDETKPATEYNLVSYRKVLFQGTETKIVGLPSGKWNFKPTEWSYKYEPEPDFTPAHDANGYINIINAQTGSNGTDKVTVTFSVKEGMQYVRQYQHRKVNRMIPKTQSN